MAEMQCFTIDRSVGPCEGRVVCIAVALKIKQALIIPAFDDILISLIRSKDLIRSNICNDIC